jgi:prepilin-type N-terminal cleavage/methylation domain-containing protein
VSGREEEKVRMRNKGFTLLELIIVVIVIGILASIALPKYIRTAEKGRVSEAKALLGAIRDAQTRYGAQYNYFTTNIDMLDVSTQTKYFTYTTAPAVVDALTETAVVGVATRTTFEKSPTYGIYTINITSGGKIGINNATLEYLL